MFDLDHPFFRPLSRRIIVTLIVVVWSGFEFVAGSPFFAMLFAALGAWCGWSFFGPNAHATYSTGMVETDIKETNPDKAEESDSNRE